MKHRFACVVAALACGALLLTGCIAQETYTPKQKDPAVGADALQEEGVLKVGVDTSPGKAPLAGLSGTRVVGLDVDLAVWLADEMGLKLQIVDVAEDPVGALESGQVDILLGLSSDDKSASVWKSDAYLTTGTALFSTDPNAEVPADDSEPSISAEAAKASAWLVANEFGAGSLVSAIDMGEVFEMLRDGDVQFAAADALIGAYAAFTVHCDAYPVALMQKTSDYCVGVLADNTALQQAVSTAMSKLANNGILTKIVETKWLGKP
ncbi:MAG: transporter substrate-binding domain-containing protein, partial [Eggerthellaceae bacterium]|nr:transporter substrate-binding domain-containing protein [Eggerthellaceae bacterium]